MIEHGVAFCDKILEIGTCGKTSCRDCEFWKRDHAVSNADRIRSMSDEELALWLAKFTDCGECPVYAYPHCTTSEESCACRWHEWLKEEAKDG